MYCTVYRYIWYNIYIHTLIQLYTVMHNYITACIHTYGKYTQTYTHTYIYDTMTAQHRKLSIMYRSDACGTYQPEVA